MHGNACMQSMLCTAAQHSIQLPVALVECEVCTAIHV